MTPLSLALSVVLATASPLPLSPSDAVVRERAWKVTLAGTLVCLLGVGFLVAGTLVLDTNPAGETLNTGHAFQTGGIMLASAGVLLGLLSIPMWMWRTQGPPAEAVVALALGPGSLRLTW